MNVSPDHIALLEAHTGLSPLPTEDGLRYFEDFLRSDATQGVALYGIASRIAASIAPQPATAKVAAPAVREREVADGADLFARTEAHLKALIGEEIGLDPERIGSSDPLESFGLDSVMINRLNARLETDLGPLPKTLFYEHETVHALATFLLRQSHGAMATLLGDGRATKTNRGAGAAHRDTGACRAAWRRRAGRHRHHRHPRLLPALRKRGRVLGEPRPGA